MAKLYGNYISTGSCRLCKPCKRKGAEKQETGAEKLNGSFWGSFWMVKIVLILDGKDSSYLVEIWKNMRYNIY